MWHLETWFSGELGSAGLTEFIILKGFSSPNSSVIPWGQYSDKEVPVGNQAGLRRVPVSDQHNCWCQQRPSAGVSAQPGLHTHRETETNREAQSRTSEGGMALGCLLGGFTGILTSPNLHQCLWVLLKGELYNLPLGWFTELWFFFFLNFFSFNIDYCRVL